MSRIPGSSGFDSLSGVHAGRPAVIMGGGPSLPAEFDEVYPFLTDPVLLSANQHGHKYHAADYIVALDNIPDLVCGLGVPVIGYRPWADFRLFRYWDGQNSAVQAAWCAYQMGCHPIVVVGCDCYQGDTYWHGQGESAGHHTPLHGHINKWRRLRRDIPTDGFRAGGGPLAREFGQFVPGERIERPEKRGIRRKKNMAGVKVSVLSSFAHQGEHYQSGTVAEVAPGAAKELEKLGRVAIHEEKPEPKPAPKKRGRPKKAKATDPAAVGA